MKAGNGPKRLSYEGGDSRVESREGENGSAAVSATGGDDLGIAPSSVGGVVGGSWASGDAAGGAE